MSRRSLGPCVAALICLSVVACVSSVEAGRSPARTQSATFQNGEVRLAYTLDLPPGAGPFPAIVTGHGSGRTRRQDLARFAAEWTRMGFAVLRFDKRGVGESTGKYVFVGTNDSPWVFPELARDIVAGARFLRTRPQIDPRRVGLAGWSQAGWVLPEAARALGDAAFLVLFSGPVCSVGQEMYYSDLAENTRVRYRRSTR
jgi:cephalosporin-C deacetylase-like acetyl esterase